MLLAERQSYTVITKMNPSTHSRFKHHAEVFWLIGTNHVLHSPVSPMTVVSIQGADGSCGSYSEVREVLWHLRQST